MNNRYINNKKRVLEELNDLDGDITISQLREAYTEEITEYEDKDNKYYDDIIEKFTGAYLMRKITHDLFGEQIELLHIESIELGGFYDTGARVLACKHTKVSFNKHESMMRTYDDLGHVHSHLDGTDLLFYNVITKEVFDEYVAIHTEISNKLNEVLTKHKYA